MPYGSALGDLDQPQRSLLAILIGLYSHGGFAGQLLTAPLSMESISAAS